MNFNGNNTPKFIGIALTVLVHCALLFVCFNAGLKYIYPPPQEHSTLIEFEDELNQTVSISSGTEPRSEHPDPEKDVEIVQRSQAQTLGTKANEAMESTVGDQGDVEVPEPERKEINQRALFTNANNRKAKDTVSMQTADRISDALAAGHSLGNTDSGNTEGEPSAKLYGRSILGSLPIPTYTVQKAGKVVVRITVNRNGKVTSAIPGYEGTTVQDHTLWEEAKKAALSASFNVSNTAPESQEGTITYIFKLK